jgi:hypothetical protein
MQTTLFGLALALIAAIVSALAAPLFVDWSAHRDLFEARLSAVLAAPVTIAGPIDAALLPTPGVTFHDVTSVKGGVLVRVQEVRAVLSLGALLRGEVKAESLVLVAPKVEVELDAAAPAVSAAPAADLTVEQLTVENATLAIHQRRAGRTVTFTDIDASGQLGSLAGPFRLEGRAGFQSGRVGFRLASGGLTEAGLRLRLTVQAGRPSIDVDGSLRVEDGEPRFDGQVVVSRAGGEGPLSRVLASGKLAATLDAVRFDTLTLSAGPEEQALELSGSARLNLGRQMRLDAVLGARQLDLDRVFGAATDAPALPPLAVLAGLVASVDLAGTAELPVRLGLSADAVTLGGEAVRDVRLDLAGGRTAWTVQHFEAHLPGRTDVRVAGDAKDAAGFQGQLALDAADPGQLMRWLDNRPAAPGPAEPLKAEAKIDLRPGRLVLDDLKLSGAGLELAGRLSWLRGGERGALAADLTGATLDLDALGSLARTAGVTAAAAFAGDVRLNLGIDTLRYAGVTAKRVETRLGWDAGALRVDHLKVVDYGGLGAEAQGELARGSGGLEGGLRLSLALDGTKGLDALADMAALPKAVVQRLEKLAVPARLAAEISASDGGKTFKAALNGKTAAGPLEIKATAPVEDPAAASVQASLAASGASLLKLIGLDGPAAEARLTLAWSGPAGDFQARVAAPAFEAEARGRLGLKEGRLDPDLAVTLAKADLAELMPALSHGPQRAPLPASAVFILTRRGDALRAAAIEASLAGIDVSGELDIALASPAKLSGALNAMRLDLPALTAALVGRSAPAKSGAAKGWPAEPFGAAALAVLALDLKVTTPCLMLLEGVMVGDARLALVHAAPRSELTVAGSTLAGGSAQGRLVLTKADSGVGTDLHLVLAGADLATLLAGPAAKAGELPAGKLSLAIDATGTGRTPADLVRTLAGNGTLKVERLSWPGLSPAALGTVAGLATRERVPAEAALRSAIAAALARGPLILASAEAPLAVLDGQLRVGPLRTDTAEATVRATGALDLAALTLAGDLALAPKAQALPGAPDLALHWAGPAHGPERNLDVSRLMTGLTLAAAERAGKLAQEKTAEVKATEVKATEAKAAQERTTEAKPKEAKAIEAKAAQEKTTEANTTEAKTTEAKATEAKAAEEKAPVDRAVVGTIPAPANLKAVPLPPLRPQPQPIPSQPSPVQASPAQANPAQASPAQADAEAKPAAAPPQATAAPSPKPSPTLSPKSSSKPAATKAETKRPAKRKVARTPRQTPSSAAPAAAPSSPEPFLIDRILKRSQGGESAKPGAPSRPD